MLKLAITGSEKKILNTGELNASHSVHHPHVVRCLPLAMAFPTPPGPQPIRHMDFIFKSMSCALLASLSVSYKWPDLVQNTYTDTNKSLVRY